MTVHFICRGNANRSVMAEAYLKSLQIKGLTVRSSGAVADAHRVQNEAFIPGIDAFLKEQGLGQWVKSHPDQLTQQRVDGADVTVCMNQRVVDEAKQIVTLPANTIVWSVDDAGEGRRPAIPGDNGRGYAPEIYREITKNVDELVRNLNLKPAK
jgi:protein-tyrosine-phosphatase